MTERSISLAAIRDAETTLRGRIHRTPMLSSRTAARVTGERLGVTLGAGPSDDGVPRLLVKGEHLQVTGSFKVRGAINRLPALDASERERGVVTASNGNHGQAVAFAGAAVGVPVTVVMPAFAMPAKVDAATGYGATVVLHGSHFGEALAYAQVLRDERGMTLIHAYDDPAVIAGQGTVGLEILADVPNVDVLVVGAGGGGLVSGVASAVKAIRPACRIVVVEPEASDALGRGVAAGAPVSIVPATIADGLGAAAAGEWTLPIAARLVDRFVVVSEAVIARGVAFALERMKQLLEPAGAAALGAVIAGAVPIDAGATVVCVASGGNVDIGRLPDILALAAEAD
ncbi:MAG: threonine/serine dehydratase [Candidatus Limnocylindrales bacterium]